VCAAASEPLHYPAAVSQRGRPQKRKQRLFENANRLTPFERQKSNRRDELRLKKLVGPEIAADVLENGYLLQAADIAGCSHEVVAFFADERTKLPELQGYFAPDVFTIFRERVDACNVHDVLCGVCSRRSGEGSGARVKWVQCDGCLTWVHVNCAALSQRPKGYWYCSVCED